MNLAISTYFSMFGLNPSGHIMLPNLASPTLNPITFAENPFNHVGPIASIFAPVLERHGNRRTAEGNLVVVESRYTDGCPGRYELLHDSRTRPDESATLESFLDDGRYVRVNYFGSGMAGSVMVGKDRPDYFIAAGQAYDPASMHGDASHVRPISTIARLQSQRMREYLQEGDEENLIQMALLFASKVYAKNGNAIRTMQIQASDEKWYDLVLGAGKAFSLPGLLPDGVAIDSNRFAIRSASGSSADKYPYVEMKFQKEARDPRDQIYIMFNYDSSPSDTIPLGPTERSLLEYFDVFRGD